MLDYSVKIVAKNTLLLYFRQIVVMVVNLYTVRIILNILGVEDYGIYNVVGGVVIMFSFLSSSMASASQRYLSYELGRKDFVRLKGMFSLILLSYMIIVIFIVILCETIGFWFINSYLTISISRLSASNWVYQCSILSFIIMILITPFQAAIIAREKMNIYAYVSLIEALLKLSIVYLLFYIPYDKLKTYSVLTFFVSLIIGIFYYQYCRRKIAECRDIIFFWNWIQLKEFLLFSYWNIIGSVANIMRSQGINILLNVFFNPTINAARAISYQINAAIMSFSNNFYMAMRPQIIKRYSSNDIAKMNQLIYQSSKYSFFLLMVLSLPVLFNTEELLKLWLKEIPEYTIIFTQLVILNSLIEVLNIPIATGMQATGYIKKYQLTISIVYLLILPISLLVLYCGYPPYSVMFVSIFVVLISFFPRLYLAKKTFNFSYSYYMKNIIFKILIVFFISSFLCIIFQYLIPEMSYRYILITLLCFFTSIIVVFLFGISKNERKILYDFFMKVINVC
jgi:O-antigen/teichoic acid export membrane protein